MKRLGYYVRISYVFIWSIFSLLNFILWWSFDFDPFSFVLGFHFPVDSFLFFIGNVFDSSGILILLPWVALISAVLYVMSLFRLNKGYMFEWLIVADTAFSIVLWGIHCILTSDTSVAYMFIIRGVKLAVILGIMAVYRLSSKYLKKGRSV